jgi:hopanoid biosynthesis associated protein HpnK
MSRKVIINADDFGLCEGVNRGIFRARTDGILTSATLMARAEGAEEAIDLARQMPDLGVGVHLNLVEGKPVSEDPKVGVLLNAEGEFGYSASRLAIKSLISRQIAEAIEIELAAQIAWILDRRIVPTHLDSHKHVHAFPTIWPIVCRLAGRFGISAVRWPYEPTWVANSKTPPPTTGGQKRARIVRLMAKLARRADANFIKNEVLFGVAHTGKIDVEFWTMVFEDTSFGIAEVMTHPGYTEGLDASKTRLVDARVAEMDALCTDDMKRMMHDADIEGTHYGRI